ncbi:MAG TPA: hypothetical protein VGD58_05460, partial [Herpetosiphonaceae bacterium]
MLAIPFFLPNMHERYFYLADITIIYAFYFPRLFLIPIVMQLVSVLSDAPYLLNTEIIRRAAKARTSLIFDTASRAEKQSTSPNQDRLGDVDSDT